MPSFFQFTQGSEAGSRPHETAPLLGRFRAVPPRQDAADLGRRRHSSSALGLLSAVAGEGWNAYGTWNTTTDSGDDYNLCGGTAGGVTGGGRREWVRWAWRRWVLDLWVEPRQAAVTRVLDGFWSRYGALIVLPAVVAVGWCAIPIPQYPFSPNAPKLDASLDTPLDTSFDASLDTPSRLPGHGTARVQLNFWFFLVVYYGFYNLTALAWITKLFNLYNLNWWPKSLGFPLTFSLILAASVAAPIPIYLCDSTRFLTAHNTAWISWTFVTMAVPLAISFLILMTHERHLGLRTPSDGASQSVFMSWAGSRHAADVEHTSEVFEPFSPNHSRSALSMHVDTPRSLPLSLGRAALGIRRSWLPASFVRFLWFCMALFVGLMAYVIGEAYAEIYLRTLPHDNFETIFYVYSWVATVHLLDMLTGWILGIREGERVGSYPLSWIFKLYFTLTYQTYVRALYARLRSPQQFILLQLLSSTSLIALTPIMMTRAFHAAMTACGFNGQSYASYQKLCLRNLFIRFLAENASMAAFLGSVLVLHFGPNKDVYPYFAFDEGVSTIANAATTTTATTRYYDFNLTFYASSVTWACELAAALIVRLVVQYCFGLDVGAEAKMDLTVWPELLPTCVAVMVHVLQNMFFSIVRLSFR